MTHNSKFSLFAFLAFICAAVSGCTSTSALSSDPQTAEDILRASTEHSARVTFINGNAVDCWAVAIRKDSTRWRLFESGSEVSVPTNSVYKIEVPNPKTGIGVLIGAPVGAVAGAAIGAATYTPPPPTNSFTQNLGNAIEGGVDVIGAILIGGAIGLLVGGIAGGAIGATNGTIWTRDGGGDMGSPTWVPKNGKWVYIPYDTLHSRDTTQAKLPH